MPDGPDDENAPPQKRQKTATGQYSVANLAQKKEKAAWHLLTPELAAEYARGHGCKSKMTLKTGLFPGVTYNQLDYALAGQNKRLSGDRNQHDVLTTAERQQLAGWVMSSARGKDPATNAEVSDKVVLVLKGRQLDNKKRRHCTGTVALTDAEKRLVTAAGTEVSLCGSLTSRRSTRR